MHCHIEASIEEMELLSDFIWPEDIRCRIGNNSGSVGAVEPSVPASAAVAAPETAGECDRPSRPTLLDRLRGLSQPTSVIPEESAAESEDAAGEEPSPDTTRGSDRRARSAFALDASGYRERHLASALALIFGKLAEDQAGLPVDGDDEWDMQALALRRFTGRSINTCRMSLERLSILLILDTSPSCSRLADFYARIAQLAAEYGDVQILDAPNACLAKRWDARQRVWVPYDAAGADGWPWKGRTIVFFGDYDGTSTVVAASGKNRIWWLNPDLSRRHPCSSRFNELLLRYKGRQLECAGGDDLIRHARKMR